MIKFKQKEQELLSNFILTLICVKNNYFSATKITQVKMESLPEIDVVNSSPSDLLASPLNITIQQNVNEDNNSSSKIQEPMETIPVEQIDQINAKSQQRKYPDITADKPFMESSTCPPFIKPSKQDKDRFIHTNLILKIKKI